MAIFDTHSYLGGSAVPGVAHSPAALREIMRVRGIGGAIVMSNHARSLDPLAGNRVLARVVEQAPELYGCLVVHANRVDSSLAAMRELMPNRKVLGMLLTGMDPSEPIPRMVADEIVNPYRRFSKPLFLYARNAATTEASLQIARAFPMLKVVLLGMGGEDWRTGIAAAHAATNVYVEISGSLDLAKLPAVLADVPGHRVLFGSGSPHMDPAAVLGLIEDCDISPEATRRILSDNARRLFGLDHETT